MAELAINLSKSLTEVLDLGEKRFNDQQLFQRTQKSEIDALRVRVSDLETKCQVLSDENAKCKARIDTLVDENEKLQSKCQQLIESDIKLESELSTIHNKQDDLSKSVSNVRTEIDGFTPQLNYSREFPNLIVGLMNQMTSFNAFRDEIIKKLKESEEEQNMISKKVEALDQELSDASRGFCSTPSPCRRPPPRSPSIASSFLHNQTNGHGHRFDRQSLFSRSHEPNGHYVNKYDQGYDLSDAHDPETLRQQVNILGHVVRSADRSIGSNE